MVVLVTLHLGRGLERVSRWCIAGVTKRHATVPPKGGNALLGIKNLVECILDTGCDVARSLSVSLVSTASASLNSCSWTSKVPKMTP